MEDGTVYEKIIQTDNSKHTQIRLTVNVFRGIEYLHFREYYLDFNEEWKPTNKGLAMPITIENVMELYDGLVDILADKESETVLEEYFSEYTI